jgi:hypothetical protein
VVEASREGNSAVVATIAVTVAWWLTRERSTGRFYGHGDHPFAATAPRQGTRSKAPHHSCQRQGGGPAAANMTPGVCRAWRYALEGVYGRGSCLDRSMVGPHDLEARPGCRRQGAGTRWVGPARARACSRPRA